MKLAVSSCLLGEPCRYDAAAKPCKPVLDLADKHEILPICPEVAGGLPTPRIPSEITPDGKRVLSQGGEDVTEAFAYGAQACLQDMMRFGCDAAILKSKSPSCGSGLIYDGTFTGTLTEGWGVAAALIRDAGITVYDEGIFESNPTIFD